MRRLGAFRCAVEMTSVHTVCRDDLNFRFCTGFTPYLANAFPVVVIDNRAFIQDELPREKVVIEFRNVELDLLCR